MTYYLLPQIEYTIKESNLKLTILQSESNACKKEYSLKKYLSKIKGLIDKHLKDWDVIKNILIHMNLYIQLFLVKKYLLVRLNLFLEHFLN